MPIIITITASFIRIRPLNVFQSTLHCILPLPGHLWRSCVDKAFFVSFLITHCQVLKGRQESPDWWVISEWRKCIAPHILLWISSWNLSTRHRLSWHHTGRFVRTCRKAEQSKITSFVTKIFLSLSTMLSSSFQQFQPGKLMSLQ